MLLTRPKFFSLLDEHHNLQAMFGFTGVIMMMMITMMVMMMMITMMMMMMMTMMADDR